MYFGSPVRDAGSSRMRTTQPCPEMCKIDALVHSVSEGEKKCLDMIEQDQWELAPERGGREATVLKDRD